MSHEHEHEHCHSACRHDSHHHSHDHQGHSGCSCGGCREEEMKAGPWEWISFAAAFLLALGSLFVPIAWIQILMQAAAALLVGWKMLLEGLKEMARLSLDETTLMTVAAIAAFCIGEGFEGAMVTILFAIGEYIENRAVQKGRRQIDALVSIVPEETNRISNDGSVAAIPVSQAKEGEAILIRAGERVPLDCVVVEGASAADTSAVTGESQPMAVEPGSRLLSGMVNLSGVLRCKVERDAENSTAGKIAQMVREATEEKGRTEKFITRFSRVYTPVVVILAILLAALPPLLGLGAFSVWIHRALIFLVASCPCALVISIPLTFYSVVGKASNHGILIKGTKHIESIASIKQVVFDKTGTLTTGQLTVSEILPQNDTNKEEILRLAAVCETASVHPIAQAVREAAGEVPQPDSAEDLPGKGVKAMVDGKLCLCGSRRLMEESGVPMKGAPEAPLYLAVSGSLVGAVRFKDTLRPEAAQTIAQLRETGVARTVMLTGDRKETAEQVRQELDLSECCAELLPQGKTAAMQELKKNGVSAFVGDGINDGPVLAAADVGFAMGMGSDLAAQAADIILLGNKLTAIPKAIAISRKGMAIAKENLVFILWAKAVVLILGALGYAPMWAAVFADVGVCLLTVLNAMRMIWSKK